MDLRQRVELDTREARAMVDQCGPLATPWLSLLEILSSSSSNSVPLAKPPGLHMFWHKLASNNKWTSIIRASKPCRTHSTVVEHQAGMEPALDTSTSTTNSWALLRRTNTYPLNSAKKRDQYSRRLTTILLKWIYLLARGAKQRAQCNRAPARSWIKIKRLSSR